MNIEALPLASIQSSPHNPRIFREKDPELASLAESVAKVGVLQPILVRPLPAVAGEPRYQLIAGERRWRAAGLAKLETIPALLRLDLTDQEALELTVTENLQREDLHPLEEANGVAALLGDGHDYRAVADRLGKSLGWVAKRARLTKLSSTWRKLVAQADSAVAQWPAAALELVARLEPKAQDEFFQEHQHLRHHHASLRDLERQLAEYTRELKLAPWKLDDETLDPQAGACTTCPKRSSCHPGLFDDDEADGRKKIAAGDRCLDATCWERKLDRHLARKADELRAEHGNVVFAGYAGYGEKPPAFVGKAQLVDTWAGAPAKKGDAGAVPVLTVSGGDRGNVQWRKFGKTDGARAQKAAKGGKPAVLSLAERRKKLSGRRQAHALEAICEAVEKALTPTTEELLALAAVFGTAHTLDHPGGWDHGKPISPKSLLAKSDATGRLWKSVAEVIARRWRKSHAWHGLKGIADIQPEIAEVSKRIGLDVSPFAAAAVEAIPEPKAWAKLADGAPAKAKKSKASKPRKAAA